VLPNLQSREYVEHLKTEVKTHSLPVNFLLDASPANITAALSSASIYWHLTGAHAADKGGQAAHGAGGSGKGSSEDPASVEHFGISIVEAMSSGCIPIVLNKG
jgi:glycosyltransferase involved in cell wall biosynthesis